MSVELHPEELGFRRPFSHEVTETLKISNTSKTSVAFKVKTTAPKQYCVRPNSGVVSPESSVEVQVLLQAMKEDPPLDARCRDKFLVQSVPVPSDDDSNIAALWSSIEKTNKSAIQEKKIRVHFLPAGGASTNGVTSGIASHEEHPPAYNSPSPTKFGSPAPTSNYGSVTLDSSPEKTRSPTYDNATETSGVSGVMAAVTNSIPTTQQELNQQLSDAQAQISKLTSQLADPQLRQRKVQEASEKVQTVVQQTNESGVPLQIVAGLCLLSFLIAYLFF